MKHASEFRDFFLTNKNPTCSCPEYIYPLGGNLKLTYYAYYAQNANMTDPLICDYRVI